MQSRCRESNPLSPSLPPSLVVAPPGAEGGGGGTDVLGRCGAIRGVASLPPNASLDAAAAGPALQCFAQVRDLTLDRASEAATETS